MSPVGLTGRRTWRLVQFLGLIVMLTCATLAQAQGEPARSAPREVPGEPRVLPPNVLQALERAAIPASHATFVVQNAVTGATVLAHNESQPFNPASVIKIVTTLAGLELLGSDFRWRTPVYADRNPEHGKLNGNLYLKGSGDPKFLAEHLWMLLIKLRDLGVQEITGDVVLDRSAFQIPAFDASEFDGEELRAYNQGPNALLLNFQALTYTVMPNPAKNSVALSVYPPLIGVVADTRVKLTNTACGDWRRQLQMNFDRPVKPVLRGKYSRRCGENEVYVSMPDANEYTHRTIAGLLQQLGMRLHGSVREGVVPQGATELSYWDSAPLVQMVQDINKFSNNVMARQLFLSLSLYKGQTGTLDSSKEQVRRWLERIGLAMPELDMDNGCGLSRSTRISAQSLAHLLRHGWQSDLREDWISSFPVAGVDGTLRHQRGQPWSRVARLKTGTLKDARAVAGVVRAASGAEYIVVAMINDPRARQGFTAIQQLLDWVVEK